MYLLDQLKKLHFWIKRLPANFESFVENCVEEINKLTSLLYRHHCPGTDNLTGLVSREANVSTSRGANVSQADQ